MHACSLSSEEQRITAQLTAEDYAPLVEGIGHAPQKGVIETHLNCHGLYGRLSLRVLQVYGQHRWFRKWTWMLRFQDVTNVMFCVSLADYNEPGISDEGQQVCEPSYVFP